MKKRIKIIGIILVLLVTSSCTRRESEIISKTEKVDCMLNSISSDFSFACKGEKIMFLTIQVDEIRAYNGDTKKEEKIELPEGYETLEISAGQKNFYVYCYNAKLQRCLRIYSQKFKFLQEVNLPFDRCIAKDGIIWGLFDNSGKDFWWGTTNSNSDIEATHYIQEEEFLSTYAGEIDEWNKIEDLQETTIEGEKLYKRLPDSYHKNAYYSTEKKIPVLDQVDYLRYCDGKIASAEDDSMDTNVEGRIDEIYSMMHTQEKNFDIHTMQKNNKIYGVCNVYYEDSGMLNLLTKNIKYSFTFAYDEAKDTLYKIKEYDKLELIYTDGEHLLSHKEDGVYFQNIENGKVEKVYDYDGAISVSILDGYARIEEVELHYDDSIDKQSFVKLW